MQDPPVFPLRFSIHYPDRELDRMRTLLRFANRMAA